MAAILLLLLACTGFYLKPEFFSSLIDTAIAAVGKREVSSTPLILIYDVELKTAVSSGSGTVIDSRGYILTNHHVVSKIVEDPDRYLILALFTTDSRKPPSIFTVAVVAASNEDFDLALLKIIAGMNAAEDLVAFEKSGIALSSIAIDRTVVSDEGVELGDQLQILGYPGFGGITITYTSGTVSGFQGIEYGNSTLPHLIKTDAKINPGNSGGGAYDAENKFVGVAVAVSGGYGNIGYVISLPVVNYFLEKNLSTSTGTPQISPPLEISPNLPDADLVKSVKGYILLQVESHGEAWYVNPDDGMRYYMSNGVAAFSVMRKFGLGISNANIAKIPTINDAWTGDRTLINRLRGKILIQVESGGDAWYVYPGDGKRYFLAKPDDALRIMRLLGRGITNADLAKIPIGTLSSPEASVNPQDCSAVNCSLYGSLSRPVFDTDVGECRCGCLSGAIFNKSNTQCVTYAASCAETWSGTTWNGTFNDAGQFMCDCEPGLTWNDAGTACLQGSSPSVSTTCDPASNIAFGGQCYPRSSESVSSVPPTLSGDGQTNGCEINHGTGSYWNVSNQRCECRTAFYAATTGKCEPIDKWCYEKLGSTSYFNSNLNACVCMPNHTFANGRCL